MAKARDIVRMSEAETAALFAECKSLQVATLGKDGALYLASKEVVAVGADQWALEVIPFEKDVGVFEVHQILLA